MATQRIKRAKGQYYTEGNPFCLLPFRQWARKAQLQNKTILEPFAGAGHIINALQSLNIARDFIAYDIAPAQTNQKQIHHRDSIKNFPTGFTTCITNPPWLARNSASRRRLPYPQTPHDDLYKHCLQLCLQHCEYVAAILPATYLHSGLFQERLQTYILLHGKMFNDTDNPACLALFTPTDNKDVAIYYDAIKIGMLKKLAQHIPPIKQQRRIRFNDPHGNLGFISFDNTREPSIRFCDVADIATYSIKESSRFITRISGDFSPNRKMLNQLNTMLVNYRHNTRDVFLTPFKGMRKDGFYRRRMDYAIARHLINAA